jgi:hypothetical protein
MLHLQTVSPHRYEYYSRQAEPHPIPQHKLQHQSSPRLRKGACEVCFPPIPIADSGLIVLCDRTATDVLAAVQKATSTSGFNLVTLVGHSLGTSYSISVVRSQCNPDI